MPILLLHLSYAMRLSYGELQLHAGARPYFCNTLLVRCRESSGAALGSHDEDHNSRDRQAGRFKMADSSPLVNREVRAEEESE